MDGVEAVDGGAGVEGAMGVVGDEGVDGVVGGSDVGGVLDEVLLIRGIVRLQSLLESFDGINDLYIVGGLAKRVDGALLDDRLRGPFLVELWP